MGHWDGAQVQAKMTKITQKHPYLWRSPQKKLKTQNNKKFSSILTPRLAESVEGLNSSLALPAGNFLAKIGRANILACAVV